MMNLKPSVTLIISNSPIWRVPIILDSQVQAPWPDLAIAAGRKTIPYPRLREEKYLMTVCKQ